MARRKPHVYRVCYPAELLFDVKSSRPLTDERVRARAERIARRFLDQEDGCDIPDTGASARVYILGPKAYRETDGQPGDFAVVDECRE